ncbi:MAG: hypothetical protein CMI21_05555 [Opitutae bacterium]|nr:hypothetical protein [Opitutae bacterium]
MPTSGQPADPPCPMRSSLVVFLFSSLGLAFSWADPVASPSDLEARKLENPLGLSLPEYGLLWKAPGQAGYRVLVSSAEDKLAAGVGDLWDSGRRHSSETSTIPVLGRALGPGRKAWWKVRAWDGEGRPGEWSASSLLKTSSPPRNLKPLPHPTTLVGKARFVSGKIGQGISLGSATLEARDYQGLRSTAGTTLAAWVKLDEVTDGWQCVYRKEDGARRLLAIGKDGPFWGVWCGFYVNGRYLEFGAPFDRKVLGDGRWRHLAATHNGKELVLYVDGKPIGRKPARGELDSGDASPAGIGSYQGNRERFRGSIDDLRVYDRGLTPAEVSRLATADPQAVPEGLVAHWTFDGTAENAVTFLPEVGGDRIALLGGSLIHGMEAHGYFEAALTARWPGRNLTFRNLGWPADDVLGTARGEFGSARNTRSWQPPGAEAGFGYSKLLKHLAEAAPSTLIVGYGAEAAYADTEDKMKSFRTAYEKLIVDLEAKGYRLVLLTPIPLRQWPLTLPDPGPGNRRLKRAASFILDLARERKHLGIDLFSPDPALEEGYDYQDALHLSPKGYRQLSARLVRVLGLSGELVLRAGEKDGGLAAQSGSLVIGSPVRTKAGLRFDLSSDRLPSVGFPLLVSSEANGTELWRDGHRLLVAGPQPRILSAGPLFEQAERLRRLIVEKNTLYRHKLRPINEAYIFLFRRHEMGHLAKEMEDFDELVAGKEELIARAAFPAPGRYELRLPGQWRAPRRYPDHEVPQNIPVPDPVAELKAITVPEGFELNLFAANPMIRNPINLNWDSRGRAWVSTSTTYPHVKPGKEPNDRIVILEDLDRDGVADKHTVFAEGLTIPHSVMPVEGGAYVCGTTELLFLADADGDDRSESRRVVYSGFGKADVHHMIHGLRWAPWGDLYFTQSIYINSFVQTTRGPRRMNGSGIWRFRPDGERLDAYAVGMVNPWGLAFDRWGQSFGTDGAGGSGPHFVFPGSAFPSAVGAHRVLRGLIRGKPKNTAAEFVTGGHMPEGWRGSLLANDFRANRTVRYELEEKGSGYLAREVETVLRSSHRSFRPVDIKMGPDGAVYVVDWYNPIIDHGEVDFHHPSRDKSHGRIWRLVAKDRPLLEPRTPAGAGPGELLEMLKSPAQYDRVGAGRELTGHGPAKVLPLLRKWVASLDAGDPAYEHHRLEGLWLAVSLRAAFPELAEAVLRSPEPRARAGAVRAIARWSERAGPLDKLTLLARAVEDPHPRVRLEAVCALRELGTLESAGIALRALDHEVDDNIAFALELTVRYLRDQWLPAMQAGRQVFDGEPSRLAFALKEVGDSRAIAPLVELMRKGGIPKEDMARSVVTVSALGRSSDLDAMLELATRSPGLLPSLAKGAAENSLSPSRPESVASFLKDEQAPARSAAARLCGIWKVSSAREALLGLARSGSPGPEEASSLCAALGELGASAELEKLSGIGHSPVLRAAALSARAKTDLSRAAASAAELLSSLGDSGVSHARTVYGGFISLPAGPDALAKALGGEKLSRPIAIAGVGLAHASGRDLGGLLAALNRAGGLKPLSQDLSPDERADLLADAEKKGDAARGREIYHRRTLLCSTCHLIDNRGGRLGPDLSTVGSYMTPGSLLESLLKPSSSIKQGYETVLVTTRDQSIVAGLLQRKTGDSLLLRDTSGKVTSIPNSNVAKMDVSPVSLMPPGLTASLRREEMLDLLKFLTSLGRNRP